MIHYAIGKRSICDRVKSNPTRRPRGKEPKVNDFKSGLMRAVLNSLGCTRLLYYVILANVHSHTQAKRNLKVGESVQHVTWNSWSFYIPHHYHYTYINYTHKSISLYTCVHGLFWKAPLHHLHLLSMKSENTTDIALLSLFALKKRIILFSKIRKTKFISLCL